jgi:hypothetical protein
MIAWLVQVAAWKAVRRGVAFGERESIMFQRSPEWALEAMTCWGGNRWIELMVARSSALSEVGEILFAALPPVVLFVFLFILSVIGPRIQSFY